MFCLCSTYVLLILYADIEKDTAKIGLFFEINKLSESNNVLGDRH